MGAATHRSGEAQRLRSEDEVLALSAAVRLVITTIAVCLLAAGLTACGGGKKKSASSTPAASGPAASAPQGPCRQVAAPTPKGPQHLPKPTLKLDPSKTYTATVTTNCGTFAFTLDVKDSPKTSASFDYLAKRGFYDGLTFHRVAAGFVIQGGDPLGNGAGGPGYSIVEPPPRSVRYTRGVVAMAKAQNEPSGASGSQFYVVTGEDAQLPPQYALLGHVVQGQSVVDAIGALPTNPPQDGMPTQPVVISKLSVAER